MYLSEAIRKRINYFLITKKMTQGDLHNRTGIPKSTLSALIKGTSNIPKLLTLLHICEGFGITLEEFFSDGIFVEVEGDDDKED